MPNVDRGRERFGEYVQKWLPEEILSANNPPRLRVVLKICQQLIPLTVIVACYFSRESLKDTMNLFIEIDRIFKENMVQLTYKPQLIFLVGKQLVITVLITAFTGGCCMWGDTTSICFSYAWKYFLNYEIMTHILTSLCAMLILSRQRFLILNFSATNVAFKGNFAHIHPKELIGFNAKAPEETLRTIAMLHFKLVKFSNMASSAYSFQLLTIFGFTLIRIVENVHYAFVDSKSNLLAFITEFFWLVLIIGDVYITFLIANNLEIIAAKTPKIASMIYCPHNFNLQNEKSLFLLQSHQQPLHLQAGGLYMLNNKTFLQFWGAALTYIILLQGLEKQDYSP
ncbi:putative gustatory receptor 28b [Euwallacea fornicatus]|uniref:putative gustatory receptor 28b n=1 Tax=Euwallacea fornicatus TaxID=995702 RepID=UPI00338FB9D1